MSDKKQIALYIPTELYETIMKDVPRNISVNKRITDLIQAGMESGKTLEQQSMRSLLNAVMYRYKTDVK